MAQGININQRIILLSTGGPEVNKTLESIAKTTADAAQKAQQATPAFQKFNQELGNHEVSAKATRYAVQNLTFQINDVVTSLASGISPFRTFTQQGGQFVQLFQQGGGIGNVLGTFAKGVAAWLSPMRLAVGGLAALAGGLGVLLERIESNADTVKTFQATLIALGKQAPSEGGLPTLFRGGEGTPSQPGGTRIVTPEFADVHTAFNLKEAAQRLQRQVLISRSQAVDDLNKILQANINPAYAEQIVRVGENISVAGGSVQGLTAAVKAGVPELQKYLEGFNIGTKGLNSIPSLLNAVEERSKNLKLFPMDPIDRQFKEIRAAFSDTIDDASKKLESGLVGFFNFAQKFPINFPQGLKNMFDTASAFGDIITSLVGVIDRTFQKSFRDIHVSADAFDSLLGPLGEATVRGVQKGFHSLYITADALDSLLNALAEATGRAISKGIAIFKPNVESFENLAASLKEAVERSLGNAKQAVAEYFNQSFANSATSLQDALVGVWDAFKNAATSAIGYVSGILTDLVGLANKFFSFAGTAPATKPSTAVPVPASSEGTIPYYTDPGPGMKGGGLIIGAGTGTSDSIWRPVSNGEYVVNAAATRANLPILEAINSINRPIRSNRNGFAAGGLIAGINSVDERTRFTLVIEGQHYFGIDAPDSTVNALLKHAQTSTMISTGPSPSWKGSR